MEAAEREEAKNQFSLFSEPERRDRDVQV
jgi:hypothetical protein